MDYNVEQACNKALILAADWNKDFAFFFSFHEFLKLRTEDFFFFYSILENLFWTLWATRENNLIKTGQKGFLQRSVGEAHALDHFSFFVQLPETTQQLFMRKDHGEKKMRTMYWKRVSVYTWWKCEFKNGVK